MKRQLNRHTRVFTAVLPAILWAADCSVAVHAQNASQSDHNKGAIEEIVVTATKRSVLLEDVPASIQAISGDVLDRINAGSIQDVIGMAAGVNGYSTGDGMSSFNIRGIENLATGGLAAPTVGYYYDETPLSGTNAMPDVALFDLERFEVLRGPQGTLYGEGSLGGTIRLISKKPVFNEWQSIGVGAFSVTEGGDESYQLSGALNAPLVADKLAMRLNATLVDRGGFIDNAQTGAKDVNGSKTLNLRANVRFMPHDDVDLYLSYLHQDIDAVGAQAFTSLPERTTLAAFGQNIDDQIDLVNLTANISLPWFDIVSSSSYQERRRDDETDVRALYDTVRFVFEPFFGPLDLSEGVAQFGVTREQAISQELRLVSPGERSLRWILGVWYKDYDYDSDVKIDVPVVAAVFPPTGRIYDARDRQSFTEKAVFGDIAYDLTPRLTVTAGFRAFHQELTGSFERTQLGSIDDPISLNSDSDDVLLKFSADYDLTDDVMIYALFSQGTRGGGVNTRTLSTDDLQLSYDPDSTDNYEVGVKYRGWGNRLSANVALYVVDWSDIQTLVNPAPGLSYTTNGGQARSKGVELELAVRPFHGLELGSSLTYNRARTSEVFALGGFETPEIDDDITAKSGTRLPMSADFKSNLYAEYTRPIGTQYEFSLRADWEHVSDRDNDLRTSNALLSPGFTTFPSYDFVNVRVGVSRGNWSAKLFVDNLFDENALFSGSFPATSGVVVSRPRTIGITFRAEY